MKWTFRRVRRNPELGLHPGINFSSFSFGGDIVGLVFVVFALVAMSIELPEVRVFVLAMLAGAPLVGIALWWWHRH